MEIFFEEKRFFEEEHFPDYSILLHITPKWYTRIYNVHQSDSGQLNDGSHTWDMIF